jgi:hypothetical protein
MKTTFKFAAILVFMLAIGAGNTVIAIEKTKTYNKTWSVSEIETLEVSNKFGEVLFKNEGGSQITIDVKVTVEASNENKASSLLDKIDVEFSKSGKTAKAETTIENNFNSNRDFSIDYVINIPSDKNLVVSNKYGNTVLDKLNANGDFNIQYGNINANELMAPDNGKMKVLLAYGNGSIDKTQDLDLKINYSGISLGTTRDLMLDSKYSNVDFDMSRMVQIESKYDKFNFGKVKAINANTKYTNIKIAYLGSSLKIENGYGAIKVAEVDAGFESISITNAYGQISLGLKSENYSVDASCQYCGISYPQESFKGNRIKENTTYEIDGKVGTGEGGKVYIRSRYGEIKLND